MFLTAAHCTAALVYTVVVYTTCLLADITGLPYAPVQIALVALLLLTAGTMLLLLRLLLLARSS